MPYVFDKFRPVDSADWCPEVGPLKATFQPAEDRDGVSERSHPVNFADRCCRRGGDNRKIAGSGDPYSSHTYADMTRQQALPGRGGEAGAGGWSDLRKRYSLENVKANSAAFTPGVTTGWDR